MAALQDDRKAVNIGAPRAEQLVRRERAARRHQLFRGFSSEMGPVEVLSPTLLCRGFRKLSPAALTYLKRVQMLANSYNWLDSMWPTCHLLPCNSHTRTVQEKSLSVYIRIQRLSSSQKSRRITFSALLFPLKYYHMHIPWLDWMHKDNYLIKITDT